MQQETLDELKKRIRASSRDADSEVNGLVEAAKIELKLVGVYGDLKDPLYFHVVALYCKARYGYDDSSEKYWKAYEALRDSMALSGEYKKKETEVDAEGDTAVV